MSIVDPKNFNNMQLLDFCKYNPFVEGYDGSQHLTNVVGDIMALCLVERDATQLQEKIKDLITKHTNVSIGKSLERLNTIASLTRDGSGFDGDADGVDALCYHLGGYQCEQGIANLQAVLRRFKEYQDLNKKPKQNERQSFNYFYRDESGNIAITE